MALMSSLAVWGGLHAELLLVGRSHGNELLQGGEVFMALMSSFLQGGEVFMARAPYCSVGRASSLIAGWGGLWL